MTLKGRVFGPDSVVFIKETQLYEKRSSGSKGVGRKLREWDGS